MSSKIWSWRPFVSSRRGFLGGGATAVAAAATALNARGAHAAQASNELRVGLVGCGGRGNGAALQALRADKNVRLVAMGDAFADRIDSALAGLKKREEVADRIDVPKERRFVGFDAYKAVIDAGVDVVLLATPPHFRPQHLKAAVDAGKHVFAEKPIAVDASGVRTVLEACQEAQRKRLSVVSGLCWRYDNAHRELIRRVHDGAVGDVRLVQINDFRGPIWVKPRQPSQTDMEYQMRNWYYFTWLSGDFNVEQHVHLLDLAAWAMKDAYPVKAYGTGGRTQRTGGDYGNIYDHHAVVYEWANGARLFTQCRQYAGCYNESTVQVIGPRGTALMSDKKLTIQTGKRPWEYNGERNDKYQAEHDELFAAIRKGKPINNGEYMSKSTLMGIMGRAATYTGQVITWEQAMGSTEDLSPKQYAWGAPPPRSPIPVPGGTVGHRAG